ncbi:hypothetical protein STBA_68910 [Streptomyces sp. MP131-18]|nr:hypothetical protein STBA_68910 [Streptomyces sp. MP131-18]
MLAPLLPAAGTGRPRTDDRRVVNSVMHKIRTGITRHDLPERHGPWHPQSVPLPRHSE